MQQVTVRTSKDGTAAVRFKASDDAPKKMLTVLRDVTFFIAVYLYFAGWLYAYYYFGAFGLSLRVLDQPLYTVFIYAFTVAAEGLWFLLALSIIMIILELFVRRYEGRIRFLRPFAVCVFLVFMFAVVYLLSRRAANIRVDDARRGYGIRSIVLYLPEKRYGLVAADTAQDTAASRWPELLHQLNEQRQLRLLSQTSDEYILLYQAEDTLPTLPRAKVFVVPKESVVLTINTQ